MKELLQIKKTVIDIGLKKEYRFFQISDMHISYIDEYSSDLDRTDYERCQKQWVPLKYEFAKTFNELCDERYDIDSILIFEMLCDYAVQIGADALILSGDIMNRVTESNIRYLKEKLRSMPVPVIYCLGNHGMIDENGEHRNQYERFKGLINNPECDKYDLDEIKILSFDNGRPDITEKQIEYINTELGEGKPTLIVVHKPLNLGEFGEKMSKELNPYFLMGIEGENDNTFKMLDLIKKHQENVIGVFAGHIHGACEYRVFGDKYQYTSSSGLIGAGREIIIK